MWIRTRRAITKNWLKPAIWPALAFLANPAFWAGAAKVGTTAASVYGATQAGKGGGEQQLGSAGGTSTLNPDYYLSDYYNKGQESLYQTGQNFMAGQPGSYFSPIGEIGGQTFENLLNLVKGDVGRGVNEDMARRNIRGGVGARAYAKTTGDLSAKLRWADMERALEGRKWILGEGRGMTEGVAGRGLKESGLRNKFNLSKADIALKILAMEEEAKNRKGDMWSSIFSSGIGALGNAFGMKMLGDVLGGGDLGSADTGDWSGSSYDDFGDIGSMDDFAGGDYS